MNINARLELELACFEAIVQHFSHHATRTLLSGSSSFYFILVLHSSDNDYRIKTGNKRNNYVDISCKYIILVLGDILSIVDIGVGNGIGNLS